MGEALFALSLFSLVFGAVAYVVEHAYPRSRTWWRRQRAQYAHRRSFVIASLRRFLARVALLTRQAICGLHGHDSLLHFESGRMSLLCPSCGHDSPGWDVQGVPVRREVTPLPPRPRLVRLPLTRIS